MSGLHRIRTLKITQIVLDKYRWVLRSTRTKHDNALYVCVYRHSLAIVHLMTADQTPNALWGLPEVNMGVSNQVRAG
jgi:hypothetical protein